MKLGKKFLKDLQKKHGEESKIEASDVLKEIAEVLSNTAGMTSTNKYARAFSTVSLAVSFTSAGKLTYDFYKQQVTNKNYTIKVSEDDSIYEIAEGWLMDSVPEEQKLAIFAHSSMPKRHYNYAPASEIPSKVDLKYSFDGAMEHEVEISGHMVKIKTEKPDKPSTSKNEESASAASGIRSAVIVFTCGSLEAKNAVLDKLYEEAQKLKVRRPHLYVSHKWGGFHRTGPIPQRDISSVILKEGQQDRIFDHIKRFLDNEEFYDKIGIPYRTGIMLHGTPGSGKSSTATAIAHELGLDVYYITLSAVDNDEDLSSMFSDISAGSIIILEDIDVIHASRDRKNDKGVTMSGLLNVLDGLQSPRGSIVIMTTNHLEALDPAVTRNGRVDLTENLDALDYYQLKKMCEYFIGYIPEGLPMIGPKDNITSAEIVGVLRDYIPNLENAGPAIVEFIKGNTKTLQAI